MLLLTDHAPGDQRAPMETNNEIHVVFTPVGTSILPPKHRGHFDFQVLWVKKHIS